jgi:hypothetical protein
MKALGIAALFLVCVPFPWAQSSSFPDLSDFTKSSTEHIINPIEEPFRVHSVAGTISTERSGEALADALFEIEGPGTERKIRHAVTDKHGRFSIPRVPKGTYRFKATLAGFQSVIGTIIVSRAKGTSGEIAIHMSLEV